MESPVLSLPNANTSFDPSEYNPILLATQVDINRYWPYISELLGRCVDKTMRGEVSVSDIYHRALNGMCFIFVVAKDTTEGPDVRLAIVMEPAIYPELNAMNIVALAGDHLMAFHERYWKALCGWCFMNGARAIEGFVNPAMERIVNKFGFERTSVHVRCAIDGN